MERTFVSILKEIKERIYEDFHSNIDIFQTDNENNKYKFLAEYKH